MFDFANIQKKGDTHKGAAQFFAGINPAVSFIA